MANCAFVFQHYALEISPSASRIHKAIPPSRFPSAYRVSLTCCEGTARVALILHSGHGLALLHAKCERWVHLIIGLKNKERLALPLLRSPPRNPVSKCTYLIHYFWQNRPTSVHRSGDELVRMAQRMWNVGHLRPGQIPRIIPPFSVRLLPQGKPWTYSLSGNRKYHESQHKSVPCYYFDYVNSPVTGISCAPN